MFLKKFRWKTYLRIGLGISWNAKYNSDLSLVTNDEHRKIFYSFSLTSRVLRHWPTVHRFRQLSSEGNLFEKHVIKWSVRR